MERRPGLDGECYTYYGVRAPAGTYGANSGVRPPAGQPAGPPQQQAFRAQQAALAIVQPPDARDNANALAPPVLTLQDLQNRRRQSGVGGKMACQEQRRLRQECFQMQVFEFDMTFGTWPWQDLLKNLPSGLQERLVGHGVAKFSFKLLKGVLDHNWAKEDSGERHVFEITRVDGSAWQLHYHKNGKFDDPTFIPAPIATRIAPALSVSSSDVSQPAATTDAIFSEPLAHEVRIGKSEAYVALTVLLDAHHVPSPGAVDITTEEGFHWRRWLNNVWPARDIVGDGIAKVFAVRQPPQGRPVLALCCSDDTYCLVDPSKNTRATAIERLQGWMNLEVFQNAQAATANWMSLRRPAVSFTELGVP